MLLVLDEAGAVNAGGLTGGIDDLLHADAMTVQLIGQQLNLQLPDLAAEDIDVGNALGAHDVRHQGPVDQVAQLHQTVFVRGQTDGLYGRR